MPYVSTNYASTSKAPKGEWVCAPGSTKGPFKEVPSDADSAAPDYCGQCVSYVKAVCPHLPPTSIWKKGTAVKNNTKLVPGTVIATFGHDGHYKGHAAIYLWQDKSGIMVYDQYVTPPAPKAVGPRTLRWGAAGASNNGDNFYVVE